MDEATEAPPRRFWWNMLLAVALVMFAVIGFQISGNVADDAMGPPLSDAKRTEIAQADCAELKDLLNRHLPNADSVTDDATAVRLVQERQAELHCPTSS